MGHIPVPVDVVRAAMADGRIRGRVYLCSTLREALLADGCVAGFVTPRETPWGWRHGPIYVLPEFRRRGLVRSYYAAHPGRVCVAFVADDNLPSRRLHESAGFTDWRRGRSGWFMRREALEVCPHGR